jgi:ActD protein
MMTPSNDLYGLLAEFEDSETVIRAAHRAHEAGYRCLDAFSPFPIEELSEATGHHRSHLPLVVLVSGVVGGAAGYYMMYYASVVSYPLNVGGRPLHSWPSFIPITFELTVLAAAFGAVLGMLALNGLPMPYHPVFNVPEFKRASRDRFFLCIEARDPKFRLEETRQFLQSLSAQAVFEVEP